MDCPSSYGDLTKKKKKKKNSLFKKILFIKYMFGDSLSAFVFFEKRISTFSADLVYCLWDPQISFFNKTFIKNGSHGTIHTFKNYFVIVFSVFNKISGIQTDPID